MRIDRLLHENQEQGTHETIYILLTTGFRKNQIQFLLWFTAFSIFFGSNLVEYPQSRLFQPCVIIIICTLIMQFEQFKEYLTKTYRIKRS